MKDNYLSSLVGNVIQIHRGGPDSNVGKLLDVTDEYLAIETNKNEIIYYKQAHIKSIRENSQYRTAPSEDENPFLVKANTFEELVSNFTDQAIRINGKGPESREGQLIDVKNDFLTMYSKKDGLLFYNQDHIKSISHVIENTANEDENNDSNEENNESEEQVIETFLHHKSVYEQLTGDCMNNVLKNLKYSWIKINRKGPESIEGLLVEMNDDHLVLIANNEVFRIALYHVKNFSVAVKVEQNSNEEQQNGNQSNQNQSNQNQSNNKNDSNSNQQSDNNTVYNNKVERYKAQRSRRRRQVRQG